MNPCPPSGPWVWCLAGLGLCLGIILIFWPEGLNVLGHLVGGLVALTLILAYVSLPTLFVALIFIAIVKYAAAEFDRARRRP